MDESHGNPASGVGFRRRQSSITLRDSIKDRRRLQDSMHSRYNSTKNILVSNQDRLQFSRRTFCSGKKDMADNSFVPLSFPSNVDNTQNQRKEVFQQETISERSNKREQINELGYTRRCKESLKLVSSPTTLGLQEVAKEWSSLENRVHNNTLIDASGSSETSSLIAYPKPVRRTNQQRDNFSPEVLVNSSFQKLATSGSTVGTANIKKPIGVVERCSLRNLTCTSMPQFLSSGCLSSNSTYNRPNTLKRVTPNPNREGSTSRGIGMSGCLNGGDLGNPRTVSSCTLFNDPVPQSTLRTRNCCSIRGEAVSVRTRRARNREGRANLFEQWECNTDLFQEPVFTPQITWTPTQSTVGETATREISLSLPEVSQSAGSSNSGSQTRQHVRERRRNPRDTLAGDGNHPSSMERIEEVLLALEQINQIEQFTYEQLLLSGMDSLVRGLGVNDRHRDMRLDIDNMSYEELLALEEKMGTVSTGLTEKALLECLKKQIYMKTSSTTLMSSNGEYDAKCSICQEDYTDGDEIGKPGCEHFYHMSCIQQWLRMKNWCPICKTSALP